MGPSLRGRSDEVAEALLVLRRTVQRGRGAVILVTGEAGIGKSALVRTVVDEAARMGFATGLGKAEEIGQIAPAAPLLLALRSGTRPLLDDAAFEDLRQVAHLPLWLVDRVGHLLEDMLRERPALIAVDDYQWADQLTRVALRLLIDRLVGLPVVWLLAARGAPATVGAELGVAVDGVTSMSSLPLGRLGDDTIAAIATEVLGSAPDPAVREELRGAGGNPLLALQHLAGRTAPPPGRMLPESLTTTLRRRVGALAPQTRELVELVVVWGRPLDRSDAVAILAHLGPATVLDAIAEAHAGDLLDEQDGQVAVRHDLVRHAVYRDMPAPVRAAAHRRCAEHLLATRDALAAAPHMRAAAGLGDPMAVEVLIRAAEQSVGLLPDTAAELAEQAFALVPPSDPSWSAVGERCAAILATVQRGGEALALADDLLNAVVDVEIRARLQVTAARALWLAGSPTEIVRRVDGALVEELSDVGRVRLLAFRTLASTRVATARSAAASAERVLADARALGDPIAEEIALHALGEVARNHLRHGDALSCFRTLRTTVGTGHLAAEAAALRQLDRFDEAAAVVDAAGREVDAAQLARLPVLIEAQMWQHFMVGRLDEARTEAFTLERVSRDLDVSTAQLETTMVLTLTAVLAGDLDEARRRLSQAERGIRADPIVAAPRMTLVRSLVAALRGEPSAGVAMVRPVMAAAEESEAYFPRLPEWMRVHAGIAVAAGDGEFARESAERARRAADRNPGVASLEGLAVQISGFVSGDVEMLLAAVAVLESSPRPLLLAGALADLGRALLARGDRDAARPPLRRALALHTEHGADLLAARTGALLAAAGEPVTPRPRARRPERGWDALTAAERRVTELISTGYSNQTAARRLGISANTVATHLRSVFTKLEVASRVQLANRWHAHATGDDR